MNEDPTRILGDRLVEAWQRRDCPRTRTIENWSRRTEGVVFLPKSTVHGWLSGRTIPRHWDQLRALLRHLEVANPDEWKPLWLQATSGEVDPPAPRFRRLAWIVPVAAVCVLAAGAVVAWTGAAGNPNCHDAVEYRVSLNGNVVDEHGRRVATVSPGERFVHDQTDPAQTDAEDRTHGRVVGRDVTGFVRTHKLEVARTIQVCS